MPVTNGTVEGKSASVLRDTGCSTAVVYRSLVPGDKLTGQEDLLASSWMERFVEPQSLKSKSILHTYREQQLPRAWITHSMI